MTRIANRRTKGAGSVYLQSDGYWCARVELPRIDGKRHQRKVRAKTEEAVLEKLAALQEKHPPQLPTDWLSMHIKQDDGCWLFTGVTNHKGYGRTGDNSKAHRYYYQELVGPIPKGLTLDHLCRVKLCVNPAHMEVVSRSENSRRAWQDKKREVIPRSA